MRHDAPLGQGTCGNSTFSASMLWLHACALKTLPCVKILSLSATAGQQRRRTLSAAVQHGGVLGRVLPLRRKVPKPRPLSLCLQATDIRCAGCCADCTLHALRALLPSGSAMIVLSW